jgi:hypothetical protein
VFTGVGDAQKFSRPCLVYPSAFTSTGLSTSHPVSEPAIPGDDYTTKLLSLCLPIMGMDLDFTVGQSAAGGRSRAGTSLAPVSHRTGKQTGGIACKQFCSTVCPVISSLWLLQSPLRRNPGLHSVCGSLHIIRGRDGLSPPQTEARPTGDRRENCVYA